MISTTGRGDMSQKNVNSIVSAVSEKAVLTEPHDLPALAEMHEMLGEIVKLSTGELDTKVTLEADKSAKLVEAIILREVSDPATTLETVCKSIAALESIIIEGLRLDEVVFPGEESQSVSNTAADQTSAELVEQDSAPQSADQSSSASAPVGDNKAGGSAAHSEEEFSQPRAGSYLC